MNESIQSDLLDDSPFMERMMKLSIGNKPSFTKGTHYIGIEGLKYFYRSLGHDNFKKFVSEHDIYTIKEGLRFVRRKYGKRNALKTHIKILLRIIKNA